MGMGRADPADPYSLLGLDRAATDGEIRRAFRRLARLAHPDAGGDPARFVALRRAHDLLTDPAARARLDATDPKAEGAGGEPGGRANPNPTRRPTPAATLAALSAELRLGWPALEVAWQCAVDELVPLGDDLGGLGDDGAFVAVVGGHSRPAAVDGPAVAAGTAQVGGDGPAAIAVGVADGAQRWHAGLVAAPVCAPMVLDGLVVVVTVDGVVHGLERADGATRWERRLAAEPTGAVTLGGVVVVATSDALTAVRASGEVAWVVRPHGGVTDLALGGPVVVVRSGSGAVIGLDPRSGATRWWIRAGSRWGYAPVVAGGWLWLADTGAGDASGSRLVGVDPRSGSAAHTLRCPAPVRSLHEVGGLLVVRDVAQGLTAVRRGRPLWRMVVPSSVSAPTALADAVVVATADGALRFLSARFGDEVHQLAVDLPGGAPISLAVSDGFVVVGGERGGVAVHRVVTRAGGAPPR